jgi:hypothetical protein
MLLYMPELTNMFEVTGSRPDNFGIRVIHPAV